MIETQTEESPAMPELIPSQQFAPTQSVLIASFDKFDKLDGKKEQRSCFSTNTEQRIVNQKVSHFMESYDIDQG